MTVARKSIFSSAILGAILLATAAPAVEPSPGAPLTPAETTETITRLKLGGLSPEIFRSVRVCRDIEYVRHGDQPMWLDLYLPAAHPGSDPVPGVIVITGGGFLAQNQSRYAHVAAYLAAQGYAAASISYRGTPEHRFRDSVHDAKAAVRWVRANAAQYGIDPQRLAALGQSAGGHLAGMLAVTGGVEELEGDDGQGGVSSRIQAAVALAGPFDFISRLKDGGQQQSDPKAAKLLESKRRTNGEWIGEPFSESSTEWQAASPIRYVTRDDAPLLLIHCKGDGTVPWAQSLQMYEALHPLSPQTRLVLYEGGGHSVLATTKVNAQAWEEALKFLNDVLRAQAPRRESP